MLESTIQTERTFITRVRLVWNQMDHHQQSTPANAAWQTFNCGTWVEYMLQAIVLDILGG